MEDKEMQERILVTGGAGFIGSAVVRYLIQIPPYHIRAYLMREIFGSQNPFQLPSRSIHSMTFKV